MELFTAKSSPIAGKGIFASQKILPGQHICYMEGEACALDDLLARIRGGEEVISDPLQVGENEWIDLEETCRTFNHSCNANCYIRGRNEMVALREILPGEEITFDYSMTMNYDDAKFAAAGIDKWTCKCECGAPNCRGIIDEFKALPKELRMHRLKHRLLQDYMLRDFGA